ncbi:MAG: lysophospholipid acyltransferase family protein [Planctomycetota bacterium]|jgi:KDO2-lipid IV(A) lauroyltransferase
MPKRRHPIRNWAEYLALRGVVAGLTCLDPEENLRTAAGIGSAFHRLGRSRARRAVEHIQQSFPDWDVDRCQDLAERSMRHMFQMFLVDALMMPRLVTPTTWPRYIELGEVQRGLEALEPGRPAIVLTAHTGNWELLGYTLGMLGFPIHALARPLDNPLLSDWLFGMREARGLRILTKFGATPEMHRTLSEGGIVGFTADQNAGDGGLFVPFLGRLASSYKSIGLLAMRYRTPIVPGAALRLGQSLRYRFTATDVIHPEDWEAQEDPLYYITARVNRAMELMILEAPEQYLWIHRRWKSRPRHERLGRPFPESLRRKIAALPWMDDETLGRIIEHSERSSAAFAADAGDAGAAA